MSSLSLPPSAAFFTVLPASPLHFLLSLPPCFLRTFFTSFVFLILCPSLSSPVSPLGSSTYSWILTFSLQPPCLFLSFLLYIFRALLHKLLQFFTSISSSYPTLLSPFLYLLHLLHRLPSALFSFNHILTIVIHSTFLHLLHYQLVSPLNSLLFTPGSLTFLFQPLFYLFFFLPSFLPPLLPLFLFGPRLFSL